MECLARKVQHDRAVLAHRIEHDRIFRLGHDLTENVDALGLKPLEMGKRTHDSGARRPTLQNKPRIACPSQRGSCTSR